MMKNINKDDFSKEQFSEIKKGLRHGLSNKKILLFARPSFDRYRMKLIRKALESGMDYA